MKSRAPYKKSEVTRQKIIRAALESFFEKGFEATGVKDIQERSGVSNGSIYHHFRSKEGVAAAAYMEGIMDLRADGTVAYVSPNMGGLTFAVATVPGENTEADSLGDAWSVAAMYSNSGFFASAAWEAGDAEIDTLAGASDLEHQRYGLGYDGGQWRVGVVYDNLEFDDLDSDEDIWTIGAAYDFGNNTVKGKYFNVDMNDGSDDRNGFAIGLDHNFSKRTQGYLIYADSSPDDDDDDTDTTVWCVGLNHSF